MKKNSCFSPDYRTARENFLQAVRKTDSLESYNSYPFHGADQPVPGYQGEELAIDVATFNTADARSLIILTSGVHGVEGFAGSCVQTGLLNKGYMKNLPEGVGVLIIHAVNPYGFSYYRRFNEDNIDVNRNFFNHKSPPINEEYSFFADDFDPGQIKPPPSHSEIKLWGKMVWYAIRHGLKQLAKAIGSGQKRYPTGIYYRGTKACWSRNTVLAIMKKHLPANCKKVVLLDLHTALGGYKETKILVADGRGRGRASDWWHQGKYFWQERISVQQPNHLFSMNLNEALAPELYRNSMFKGMEITSATVEFGLMTIKYMLSLEALFSLRAENWLHHQKRTVNGHGSPGEEVIKKRIKEAFSPEDPEWQNRVWQHGKSIFAGTLEKIK
jgi:hypothetical protein